MTSHTNVGITRRHFLGAGSVVAASAVAPIFTPAAAAAIASPCVVTAGDRHPGTQAYFPDSALMHNNPDARVIDVTRVEEALGPEYAPPGTNATPNDPSDEDSAAFRAVLRLVRDRLHEVTGVQGIRKPRASFVIYVPDGVYHLERPIVYPGSNMDRTAEVRWALMRIVGQSRENVILQLKDNLGLAAKAVVMFKKRDDQANADSYQHVLRNVTIDTGVGNPDWWGIMFQGANAAEIANVTIRSGDGQGRAGLHADRPVASGYIHDVTIEGFNRGISLNHNQVMNPAFEFITLTGQNATGIYVEDAQPTIRSLQSQNEVPAVTMAGTAANLVLADSVLAGGAAGMPAISMNSGAHLFARNVAVAGYGTAVERAGEPEVVGDITEWVSDPVVTFDEDQPAVSMNLMVKDPPLPYWTSDPGDWADVTDFGAVGDGQTDDAAAIQAALNSGAKVVYFPAVGYRLEQTIQIPASVRHLACLFTTFYAAPNNSSPAEEALFRVAESSSQTLFIDDIQAVRRGDAVVTAFAVDHAQPRPLSMTMIWGGLATSAYRPHPTAMNGDLYMNSVQGVGKAAGSGFRNQRVWARWINTEYKQDTNFRVRDGAVTWVLGYKSGEGGRTHFEVSDGGVLEVLGGLVNELGPGTEEPYYRVIDGNVSLVTCSRARAVYDPDLGIVVDDTQGGVNRIVHRDDLPYRFAPGKAWVLPLYVSYDMAGQTIGFGGKDSGVPNYEGPDGVRFLNAVAAHQPFADTGDFLRTVEQVLREWHRAGILTARERSAILRAAARSDVGL